MTEIVRSLESTVSSHCRTLEGPRRFFRTRFACELVEIVRGNVTIDGVVSENTNGARKLES